MEAIASKRQWNAHALDRILTNPQSANSMIELRTNCGWKALVHKPLLCQYSTYYEAAINGGFQEANSGHFNLGLNKVCAEWFVRWLYSGQLCLPDLRGPYIGELFQLYVFADEKDILALRRGVMTRLMELGPVYLSYDHVALATNSLPQSAPLYRYLIEWHIHHWFPVTNDGRAYEVLPKEFLYLVMSGIARRIEFLISNTKPSYPCCGHPCHFHEHKSYEEWCETCVRLGGVELSECPEELKPKKSNGT